MAALLLAATAASALALVAAAVDPAPAFAVRRDPLLVSAGPTPAEPSSAAPPQAGGTEPPVLPAAALQALAQDAAFRLLRGSGARVQLSPGRLAVALSIPVSATPARRWLPANRWLHVQLGFVERPGRGLPRLDSLKIGSLTLPVTGWLPRTLLRAVVGTAAVEQLQLAAHTVEHVQLTAEGVSLQLTAPSGQAPDSRTPALSQANLRRLQGHHEALVRTLRSTADPTRAGEIPLSTLLKGALAFAAQQAPQPKAPSAAGAATKALTQEYRLALLAVTLYTLQIPPALLSPELSWSAAPRHTVVLGGRKDHARHFLLSAALAMGADRTLADALGLYKELADANARRGSGFSFDDMAADHAGSALGLKLMQQPASLAAQLPLLVDDTALLPRVRDLPSQMTAEQFLQRYGDIDSPRFAAQMDEIHRRIEALPLLAR